MHWAKGHLVIVIMLAVFLILGTRVSALDETENVREPCLQNQSAEGASLPCLEDVFVIVADPQMLDDIAALGIDLVQIDEDLFAGQLDEAQMDLLEAMGLGVMYKEEILQAPPAAPAPGATTLFVENFEGGFPNRDWSVGDADSANGLDYWDDSPSNPHSGYYSAWCADIRNTPDDCTPQKTYDNNQTAYMQFEKIDIEGFYNVHLFLWEWYRLDTSSSVDDDYYIRIRKTGTEPWYYLGVKRGSSGGWVNREYAITSYGPQVDLRFEFNSSPSICDYEGVFVDDILIAGDRGTPPEICVSPSSLTNSSAQGHNAPSQSFKVWNCAEHVLNYTIISEVSPFYWFFTNPELGSSTGEADTIDVVYQTSSLSPGTYTGNIRVLDADSSNGSVSIPVTLTVYAQPTISRTPSSISNSCDEGQNALPRTFEVWNSGTGTLEYTISDNAGWLTCTPTSGTSTGEHDSISANFHSSGLSAGNYLATITITDPDASNNPQAINVSLTVNGSMTLTCTPDSTSVPRGGRLAYSVTATNNTSSSRTVQYWTNVRLPNGTIFPPSGQLLGPVTVTIGAHSSRSAHLTHPISNAAPLGTYTYNAYIGSYPSGEGEDHFSFQVR